MIGNMRLIFIIVGLLIGLISCEERENISIENSINETNIPNEETNLRRLYGKGQYNTVYEPVYMQKVQYVPAKSYKKVMYTVPEKSTYVVPQKQQMRYVPVGYAKGNPSPPQMYVPVTKSEPNVYVPVTYSKGMRYLEESPEELIHE
ncbi:unnamed protein product [Cryptosporidium hominis]|uniref:Lipoprotein n=1 Tax=Cryptosporidium hominis TaxID=237895 RepID=A0A0S4THQ0_CRYHO|nr:hypothetical protein [Cryptosporidium hominis TU502]OLQ17690.1 hypothetical protein ChTU502y2012_407g0090 [Cryptosporidium hominis]PPA65838.1 hypothetical protein ChUKH1_14860 [Cryptosporidium hominis]PPS95989.1 Uncharacterized protein GY17_00003251 [Cryptosporidium hominis]CUV06994.1 unnamed protein product [Cryptosporidium hominis]|eukprot:PPS95989.1 Uncharacterized protein GY17_00003251 [Cryptosporidium hominis]